MNDKKTIRNSAFTLPEGAKHVAMLPSKVRFAFTLAEVLITLGIIGVVAAMTIPTLIANTRASQYRSVFKKTVSVLGQAARTSQAQYDFDYAGISQRCGTNAATEHPANIMSVCAILNGTLKGYTYYENASDLKMKDNKNYSFEAGPFTKTDAGQRSINNFRAYVLNDGVIIMVHKFMGSQLCELDIGKTLLDSTGGKLQYCIGLIDVNGVSLPNKEVSCSSGSDSLAQNTCIVKNDAHHMTDIFPIRFHDGIVEPASAAARYVLKTAK